MLMNMESLLQTARKHHFAVGAFNVCDSLLFSTVMECAEEQHAPVIVELAPPEFSYVGSDFFAYAVNGCKTAVFPVSCIWTMERPYRIVYVRYAAALPL